VDYENGQQTFEKARYLLIIIFPHASIYQQQKQLGNYAAAKELPTRTGH